LRTCDSTASLLKKKNYIAKMMVSNRIESNFFAESPITSVQYSLQVYSYRAPPVNSSRRKAAQWRRSNEHEGNIFNHRSVGCMLLVRPVNELHRYRVVLMKK
jgi:hypothetical protein